MMRKTTAAADIITTTERRKTMIDEVFGHISYDDDDSWSGTFPLEFGGTWHNLYILVQVDEDITDVQRQALQCFDDKWDAIEPLLVEALIKYYNQEEKYSYGPDDKEEAALWWPAINTYEELVNAVTPQRWLFLPIIRWRKGGKYICRSAAHGAARIWTTTA